MTLDRAALRVACIEYPGLRMEPFLAQLDHYAGELRARVDASVDGTRFVAEINRLLFRELGFHGCTQDYYDPRNSCLNQVLTARTGIPITLSVVYLEVSRRLGRPVRGIGLPGHFVVRYDDGAFNTFIDPFHGGALLSPEQCFQVAREAGGQDIGADRRWLAPVSDRQILLRMLANLRGAYFMRGAYSKALEVLNLLLEVNPTAEEYKQRAAALLQLKHMQAACRDLERYLALAPGAPDHDDIEEQVVVLRHYLAGLN